MQQLTETEVAVIVYNVTNSFTAVSGQGCTAPPLATRVILRIASPIWV